MTPSYRSALIHRALAFLIDAAWLNGEAIEQGMGISAADVERRLEQEAKSFPDGEAEFQALLKATDRTRADARLEAGAELAVERVRRLIDAVTPRVTEPELLAYYRRNTARYSTVERRYFDLVRTTRLSPHAKRELEEDLRGKSLAQVGQHESLPRGPSVTAPPGEESIPGAVFAARPHVVAGPFVQDGHYFVLEVTRVEPSRLESFASVRSSVAAQLAGEQRRRTLARVIDALRRKWIARTDCEPGYVIQKCRQYRGPVVPEDPLKLE